MEIAVKKLEILLSKTESDVDLLSFKLDREFAALNEADGASTQTKLTDVLKNIKLLRVELTKISTDVEQFQVDQKTIMTEVREKLTLLSDQFTELNIVNEAAQLDYKQSEEQLIMNSIRHSFTQEFSSKIDKNRKQTLSLILSQQPIDLVSLKKFVMSNYLPSDYRTLVWKLLLGITPRFMESQNFVHHQHTLIFEDLRKALNVLRLGAPIFHQSNSVGGSLGSRASLKLSRSGCNSQLNEARNCEPEHLFFMWLISEGRLNRDPESQLNAVENQKFLVIGHKLANCNLFDAADMFHVCCALWSLVRNKYIEIQEAVQKAFGILRGQNEALHSHLCSMKLFKSSLLEDHCASLLCEILTDTAFENIVDKILAGNVGILSHVISAVFLQLQSPLLSATSVESVRNVLYQIRPQQADSALISALDLWHKSQEYLSYQ